MSVISGPNIVLNGLSCYLDAANPKSYSGTGSTWNDLSGNGNHGTILSGVEWSNGSMVFDNVNSVSIPNPLNQSNLLQEWTVMGWINITDAVSQVLVSGLNRGLYVCFVQGDNSLLYLNSGDNDYYTYGGDLGGLGWVLATFRFKNSDGSRTIYRNTTNISTSGPNATSTPSGQSSTFNIGVGMIGSLSHILFYDWYISVADITQNYNAHRSRFGL